MADLLFRTTNNFPKALHLIHVIHSLNPLNGGTTSSVRDLAEQCSNAEVASEILSLDAPSAPWLKSSTVSTVGGGPGISHYGWSPKFSKLLDSRLRPDSCVVVHGLWQHHAVAARTICSHTDTPYVVWPHGMLDPWALRHSLPKRILKALNWSLLMRRVVQEASLICFTTEAEQEAAAGSLRNFDTPQSIVPLGVSGPPDSIANLREAWQGSHPDLQHQRIVLFLGRLHHKKGCDLLIDGFARWRRDHLPAGTQYHLRMVGPPSSQAYLRHLQDRSVKAGLIPGRDVSFPGMLQGALKWQEIASAEAFILPSFQENFGLAVGEALAAGLPALLSDRVNTSRWVRTAQAGLVAPATEAGVVDMLIQSAALDPASRIRMSRRAIELYAAKFSQPSATMAFLKAVRQLS